MDDQNLGHTSKVAVFGGSGQLEPCVGAVRLGLENREGFGVIKVQVAGRNYDLVTRHRSPGTARGRDQDGVPSLLERLS